jgi:hypothetical protein
MKIITQTNIIKIFLFTTLCGVIFYQTNNIITLDNRNLIKFIPDDAFYYFQLAKNFNELKIWTFDGVNLTTGFHLLYAYFLLVLYMLNYNDVFEIIRLIIIATSLTYLSAAFFLMKSTIRLLGNPGIFSLFVFFSPIVLRQQTLVMEALFVLPMTTLCFYIYANSITETEKKISTTYKILCIVLGILVVLSRPDLIVYPSILFFCSVIINKINIKINPLFFLLLGSIIGLIILLMHTCLIGSSCIQDSVVIKNYWSHTAGYSILPTVQMMQTIFFPYQGLYKYIIVLCLSIWMLYSLYCNLEFRSKAIQYALTTILLLLVIVVIYSRNSQALMPWYAANFVVPIGFLLAFIFSSFPKSSNVTLISFAATSVYFLCSIQNTSAVKWDHQTTMMEAGISIAKYPTDFRAGSWNAGILGYFSNGKIINIDGLVNTNIVSYVTSGKIVDYLKTEKIENIIDYEVMWTENYLSERGGIYAPFFQRCIIEKNIIGPPASDWKSGPLSLLKLNLSC